MQNPGFAKNRFPNSAIVAMFLMGLLLAACDTPNFLLYENEIPPYYGTIESIDNVYDGDTIQDVAIQIYSLTPLNSRTSALWPGVEQRIDGIYSVTDIRIAGIDTPERRPLRAGRTEASLQREKARAEAATNFLKNLILTSITENGELGFVIINPQPDKYAGRTIAGVVCFKEGKSINVAEALIEAGHAVVYTGGTKTYDWGKE